MRKIKIFLVFHQSLDERLSLSEFSADEIKRWFVPYAVNAEKLPKRLILIDGSEIVNPPLSNEVSVEYQLSRYDPLLQKKGFMETSCYIHVEKNLLHEEADFVGVCQYDMRWTKRSVKLLRSLEQSDHMDGGFLNRLLRSLGARSKAKQIIYAQIADKVMNSSGEFSDMACANAFNWDYLLKSYNQFFSTSWQRDDLINQPLTLWQTYLMPRQQFIDLGKWLAALTSEVEPWANQDPYETHWGVLGGYTERAESLFMALRHRAKEIEIRPLYLEHDDQIPRTLGISKNHYGV